MLIRTNKKEPAFRAIINTWLKDQTIYCNDCGRTYDTYVNHCVECGSYHIGKNIDHCRGIVKQNREMTKTRRNRFASTDSKSMRWGVSMPIQLFYMLDQYKKSLNRPGLFKEPDELNWFMRTFKQFRVPEKV